MNLKNTTINDVETVSNIIVMEYRERYTHLDENYLDNVIEMIYRSEGEPPMGVKIKVWEKCIEILG